METAVATTPAQRNGFHAIDRVEKFPVEQGFETTRHVYRGTHYDIYLLLANGTERYIGWHKGGASPGEIQQVPSYCLPNTSV